MPRKIFINMGDVVKKIENTINTKQKIGDLNEEMKDCPQIGSPIINNIARRIEKRLLTVKHVLIKAFSLSSAPGRNLINPIPKPNSAIIAKIPKTEKRAVIRPIVDGSYNRAAIIQKRNVRPDWIPVPIIR